MKRLCRSGTGCEFCRAAVKLKAGKSPDHYTVTIAALAQHSTHVLKFTKRIDWRDVVVEEGH